MVTRTMAAIILSLVTALAALSAQAKTEALLVGPPGSTKALADLGTKLKNSHGVDSVEIVAGGNARGTAERIRNFLSSAAKPDDFQVVWVDRDGICPAFDEEPVRPKARSLIVAPTCMKLLIQAPTTYERLGNGNDGLGRDEIDPRVPPVAFVSPTNGKTLVILANTSGRLEQTLACSRDHLTLDFAPSIAVWKIDTAACRQAETVAVTPPASRPAEAVAASQSPVPTPAINSFPPAAVLPKAFSLTTPVAGKVVSAYGSLDAGRLNKGIEIEVPAGTIVKAAEAGEVVFVGTLPGYGQVMAIKHDNDWATVYARTTNFRVVQGQKVAKGQDLADIGTADNRLHFEVRHKGKAINPEQLMSYN